MSDAVLHIHKILGQDPVSKEEFDILLNIPGQRYIFGTKYEGRKEGEEFFICPFPNAQPTHCNITVDKKGNFWIQNASDFGETFVNSESLKNGEEKKLKFGDTFALGLEIGGRGKVYLPGYLAVFDFKKHEISRIEEVGDGMEVISVPISAAKVGANDLIVGRILEYFPVTQLLQFRFVSKTWNASALPLLRKRTKLDLGKHTFSTQIHRNQLAFFRCLKALAGNTNFGMIPHSLNLAMSPKRDNTPEIIRLAVTTTLAWENRSTSDINLWSIGKNLKFTDDLSHFINILNSFESLDVYFPNENPFEEKVGYELAMNVLEKLSKNLVELNLNFNLFADDSNHSDYDHLNPCENWELLKLKRLKVNSLTTSCPQFIKALLERMPCLEEFETNERNNVCLFQLSQIKFPNLCSVTVESVGETELETVESIKTPLKILKLRYIKTTDTNGLIERILKFHSETLEHLVLGVCDTEIMLKIPALKKLKTVAFHLNPESRLSFLPFDYAVYKTHFPLLEKLELEPELGSIEMVGGVPHQYVFGQGLGPIVVKEWFRNCQHVFDALFSGDQVSLKLRELKLPYIEFINKETDTNYIEKIKDIEKMFPNLGRNLLI